MAQNKTQPTTLKVTDFVNSIEDTGRRTDCRELMKMLGKVTGHRPKMWGSSMVGFGSYHYKYASGREGDFFSDRILAPQSSPDNLPHIRI